MLRSFLWTRLWGQTNIETQNKVTKLKDKALRKNMYEKKQDPAEQLCKELMILKFSNMVHLQNCLFMSQIETNKILQNHLLNRNIVVTNKPNTCKIKHLQNPQSCLIFC